MVPPALNPDKPLEVDTAPVEVERRVVRATLGRARPPLQRAPRSESSTNTGPNTVALREITAPVVHPDQVAIQVVKKPQETVLEAAAPEVITKTVTGVPDALLALVAALGPVPVARQELHVPTAPARWVALLESLRLELALLPAPVLPAFLQEARVSLYLDELPEPLQDPP